MEGKDIKSIEEQRTIFEKYVEKYVQESSGEEFSKHVDKESHSIFVLEEALLVDEIFTKYNSSFLNLLALESLFHDIGRFEQLRATGTFDDTFIPPKFAGLQDHGDLGAIIMDKQGLLKQLIPDVRLYDEEVKRVIAAHSKVNPELLQKIMKDFIVAARSYDLRELFLTKKAGKERESLFATNTSIIQDVDRLDIFRKIVRGIWIPMTTKDPIDPELFELYKKGKLPTMAEIKASGKWTSNIGHLIRLSFIDQMNLVPVLMKIREEGLIEKVAEVNANEIVAPAYEIARERLDKIIEQSEDGMLVTRR